VPFLIDTNFISETMKPRPDPSVDRWIFTKTQSDLYLSVITIAEVRRGIQNMDSGSRKRRLESWLSIELPKYFANHILNVDFSIADQCGRILEQSKRHGWNLDAMDAFIAATAQVHDLTLATLNRKHFEKLGVKLLSL
jgi:predicted nucleic acid-binding protein